MGPYCEFRLRTVVVFFVLVVVGVGLAAWGETPKVNAATARLASRLAIADLHLHPDPDLFPSEIKEAMDSNRVLWAGAGARRGSRFTWVAVLTELGFRFIAFAGQTELNRAYFEGRAACPATPDLCGVAAMEDAENPIIQDLLHTAEEDLRAGRIKGIGEIFVNNLHSAPPFPGFRRKAQADAPSIRLLYQLVAKHGAFLTFHMEPDPDNVAQLEDLLASDRRGRILWNHCGSLATPDQVRPLLERHPNLFCELSGRYPPALPTNSERTIFDLTAPDPNWIDLMEDFSDRFMIGTDILDGLTLPDKGRGNYDEAITVVRVGLLPHLRPSTARKVACANAQRLFRLIVPFAIFTAKAEIPSGPVANDGAFEVKVIFAPDTCSNGINPLTENMSIQVGTFSTSIPPGSFTQDKKGRFKFKGVINEVALEVVIRRLGGKTFQFKAEGKGADLTGTVNPVDVGVTIGDDSGSTTVEAEFEQDRLEGGLHRGQDWDDSRNQRSPQPE